MGIFRLLPTGDDVQSEPAIGNGIDGRRHSGHNGGRHDQGGGGGEEFYARSNGGQAGHEGKSLQIILPKLRLPAEPAVLDHREGKIDPTPLGFQHDGLVQLEAGLVLRRVGGDQPAVVPDGDEDTDFHAIGQQTSSQVTRIGGVLFGGKKFHQGWVVAGDLDLPGRFSISILHSVNTIISRV